MNDPLRMHEALVDLAGTFADAWTARQVGQAMTCGEAEVLAAAIRLVDPGIAEDFLRGHANGEDQGDNEGDDHYWMRDDYDAAAQDADHEARANESGPWCAECGQPLEWEFPARAWRHRGGR